ncbi:MAG: tetratricopeptide repeat protein [Thermoanaerobaculia bacterium]
MSAHDPEQFAERRHRQTSRRLLLAIFVLALAVRALYFGQIRDSPFFESPVIDARTYHERAVGVARGEWHEDGVFWQPPLYPYALGALYGVFGPKIAVARLVQLLLGAVVCVLAALLALRLHGRLAAWTAGIALSLCGPMIFFEAELLNPALSLALNLGALLLLVPGSPCAETSTGALSELGRLPLGRWLAAGLLLGLSALSRSDVLAFATLVALAPLVARAVPAFSRWKRTALFGVAVALPILPATAHNVAFGGEWVPISSNFGINFYLGNSGDYERTVGIRPGLHWQQLMLEPVRAGIAEDDSSGKSAWWTARALGSIREDPGAWFSGLGKKIALGVAAAETGRNLDPRFFGRYAPLLDRLPGWGFIFPLGAVGLLLALRARRDAILVLYLVCYALTLLAFFVSARYRLPMMPVLAVLGGYALDRIWADWRARSRSRAVALASAVAIVAVVVRLDALGVEPVDEADGHYLVAKALANRDRHTEARASLEKALALDPRHWDAVFDMAAAEINLGRPARAVPLYERILANYPEDRESVLAMADALMRLGREPEAMARLTEAATGPLASPNLVFNASRMMFSVGRVDEAVDVASKALARGVFDRYLEELYSKLTRARDERRRLTACLEEPDATPTALSPQLLNRLDRAAQDLERGEHLNAELAGAQILDGCDGYGAAWGLIGKLWFLQRSPRAAAALRRATRLAPDDAEAHLGLAYALAGDPGSADEAAAALERFLELTPHGPDADRARRALASLAALRERRAGPVDP